MAHITDVHIRPEHNAPNRFKQCLEEIKAHEVDFFLNGGDTIYAADYKHINRERVNEQWNIWKSLRSEFSEYEVHSCLGNHDMWWAAPNEQDFMYGKDYVVKQLETPGRYYSFNKQDWHLVILDSNNENAGSLDEEQRKWLEKDLAELEKGGNVLFLSHYPILGVNGGTHSDRKYITDLFYDHKDKSITCLSGHVHLLDSVVYNNVNYFCNGAISGFWWEDGNEESGNRYWVEETPPGYAIVDLFEDGTVEHIPPTCVLNDLIAN
ncbi:metallophosphoesterase family protein [Muricauda sp. SCSIO 64092]|uniref:metallophosphoesterase family protein n=1 Tax=Allomuricauda sp. SCSIO 64092 TaxID=2908842 RepID=UPI001FF236B8|nr:metallophosphoesterase [Muricauda sp. SCSIO 64092]UOY04885.1 metallophosphoesterase family protein [Muricauda sp. SCSIO 64092]